MALYPGPNIATFRTRFFRDQTPKQWSVSTYWENASAQITQANALAAATAYHNQFVTAVAPVLSDSVFINETRVRVFLSGSLIEATYTSSATGSLAGQQTMPLQDVLVIQRRTSSFGRANQGRIFISGLAESMCEDGHISAGKFADAKAIATFLGADRTFDVPYHARHWNRKLNTFVPIVNCFAIQELKSRRDRQETRQSTKIG